MVQYNSWLRNISDTESISRISIPGTHNSAAHHTALPSVQCQDASITEQLQNGVRFLDIRVSKPLIDSKKAENNDLVVIHGKFPLKLIGNVKLDKVLKDVYEFLGKNSSEFVIISLKQEGSGKWNHEHDEFGDAIWNHYINNNRDMWYLNNEIPNLRDVRGKAILFRRFGIKDESRKRDFGIEASWWKYNCENDDRGTINVQDWCELSSGEDIERKANFIKDHVYRAKEYNSNNGEPKLFINFCSASNFFDPNCWPAKIAEGLTKANIEQSFGKGSGVVILDYAEQENWYLVRNLVDRNFQ
ncbi:BA75_04383T0 [Komagataella pastoris]|uniref:BA75_04383T0 n=1 Tax=Komagataella pastoris TaxID=4922 RepID=A0A1B2JHQ6_PICPA|nr:BA75_04383T0 [Komagataella pastoris]